MHVAVLGAGSFGTAVSTALASNCDQVRLWAREGSLAEAIVVRHENTTYLPGIALPPNVTATTEIGQLWRGRAWWSVPSPPTPPGRC